ncbi:MAG: RNA polymerase sigma factor [Moraxellaceae bacterium]|nr:RNA polymerase sigma factor [Moraxellaceae bacterium]
MATTSLNFAEIPEKELISALKKSDRNAYREAMRRYGGAMLAAARSITTQHAEDAVQEAWISAIAALNEFESRASLKTWLVRIAINKAYNAIRSQRREVSFEGLEAQHDPLADAFIPGGKFGTQWGVQFQQWTDDTPDALLQAHVLQECLDHHLEDLPEGQRLAITLKDIEGLSPNEICNTLGISPSNFRVLLHRARIRVFGMVSHYEETGEC